jgi:hypothetical protein
VAASDPTFGVATPTGVLEGVAAFGWDGSQWQPSGRAAYGVGTPTGVLRGVAPFSWSGSAWTPAGQAGPSVATPSGVLQGVAVYTWNGSSWTPAGGAPGSATPTGVLRGVAAFSWDGTAWQPAAQAGPDVATPFGVLQGVAMFNWSGTAWAPSAGIPAGATLNLSFMTPGTLDPRISFTRASVGTYFDATGTMQSAGLNLVFPSVPDAGSAWALSGPIAKGGSVLAPDGTTSTTSLALATNTANATRAINVGTTIAANTIYTVSVFLKGGPNNGYIQLNVNAGSTFAPVAYYDLTAGTAVVGADLVAGVTTKSAAIVPAANGWYRASFTFTSPAATTGVAAFIGPCVTVAATGDNRAYPGVVGQGVYVWGLQIELGSAPTQYAPTTTVANSSPRWDYDPVTHALRGLLLEEARTNNTINSSNLSTWANSDSTWTANATTAPDGTMSAALLKDTTTNIGHGAVNPTPITVSTTYTASIFAKAAGRSFIQMNGMGLGAVGLNPQWDITNGIDVSTGAAASFTHGIIPLPNGWFRCWFSFTAGGTATINVWLAQAAGSNVYPGDGASGAYLWGAQVEQGAFGPTSYIPTTASAVTRAIDSCLIPPANMSPWFAPPGGSWFAEFDYFNSTPTGIRIIGHGTLPNNETVLSLGAGGVITQYDGANAMSTVNSTPANTVSKGASTWASGRATICLNGGAVASLATLTSGYAVYVANGVRFLSVGSNVSASGHIRRVTYWPRVLSNAEMQQVTT